MKHAAFRAITALVLLCTGLTAQANWTQFPAAGLPPPKSDHAMAADLISLYVWGGRPSPGANVANDTWRYLGGQWSQIQTANAPTGRWQAAMVYDAARARLVLFGGRGIGNIDFDDTWELVNNNWVQVNTATKPAARWRHRMVYDSKRRVCVMYGGQGPAGVEYDDTWEFDGTSWKQLSPTTFPPKRRDHPMTYDTDTGETIMFGGRTGNAYLADTWAFNGTTWRQLTPTASPPVIGTTHMTYDAARARVVMFAGLQGGTYINDTWEFDGATWVLRTPATAPTPRSGTPIVFSVLDQKVYSFGGFNPTLRQIPEFWSYQTDKPATYTVGGAGCAGAAGTPGLDGTKPWLGDTLRLTVTNVPANGPTSVFFGLSNTSWGTTPLPLNLAFMGAAPCNLLVDPLIMFGMNTQRGTATLIAPLPNTPSLAGVVLYNQAFAPDATANPAGIVVSNWGRAQVGIR